MIPFLENYCCTDKAIELKKVHVLNVDLSNIALGQFERAEDQRTRQPCLTAYLMCKTAMSGSTVEVKIAWDDTLLCKATIKGIEQNGSIGSWS